MAGLSRAAIAVGFGHCGDTPAREVPEASGAQVDYSPRVDSHDHQETP